MWYACLCDQSKLQPYCRQWPRLLTVSRQPSLNRYISGIEILWFVCHMNMVVQLQLRTLMNLRQGMIAATGAITVPNERYGFIHFERGIYNQVELGATYPLYKSTILGPLYVINQYQNLTVHRNPSYLQ